MKTPEEIVKQMMKGDHFSRWMGLEIVDIKKGFCKAKCVIKKEMLNGFSILHGGITFSLSDSVLAFAANSYGYKCVSIETSITHLRPVFENETLTILSEEIHRGRSIGVYSVKIYNEKNILVSNFKGTVSISKDIW